MQIAETPITVDQRLNDAFDQIVGAFDETITNQGTKIVSAALENRDKADIQYKRLHAMRDLRGKLIEFRDVAVLFMGDQNQISTAQQNQTNVVSDNKPARKSRATTQNAKPQSPDSPSDKTKTRPTASAGAFTEAKVYEPYLIQAFQNLPAGTAFADIQRECKRMMEQDHILKAGDLDKVGSNTPRYMTQTASVRRTLLRRGLIQNNQKGQAALSAEAVNQAKEWQKSRTETSSSATPVEIANTTRELVEA